MTLEQYQKDSYINIQPHTDEKDLILNWAIGLSEEVGEVMKNIKHAYWGSEQFSDSEMAKELGDVLWYLSALAYSLGLNLQTIGELNQKKLDFRFGDGFTAEKSRNRHANEMKFSETETYKQLMDKLCLK